MPTTKKKVSSSFARKDPAHSQLEILMKGLEQGGGFEDLFAAFQKSLEGLRGDINEDAYKVYLEQLVKHRGLDQSFSRQISQFLSVRSVIEHLVQNVEEQVSAPAKFDVAVGSVNSLVPYQFTWQQSEYLEVATPRLPWSAEERNAALVPKVSPSSLPSYKLGNVVFPITFTPDGIKVPEGVLKYMIELYNQKAGKSFTLSQGASIRTVPYGLLAVLGIEISPPRRAIGWFTKTPLGGYPVSDAAGDKACGDNLGLTSPVVVGTTVRDHFSPNGDPETDMSDVRKCLFPEDKKRGEGANQGAPKPRVRSSWIRAIVRFITYPVRMLLLACWMILSAIWGGVSVMGSKLLGGFSSQVAWDEPAKVNFEITTPSDEFRGVSLVDWGGATVRRSNSRVENAAACENQ